ncbi:hypothetical protein F5Y17DRAFT_478245 [Xylariaceae sp. FL0594]|nr:hypothetical protein F5Y17DRAFT_478245 [Xylariaceae sp. FL0594]
MFGWARNWRRRVAVASVIGTFFLLVLTLRRSSSSEEESLGSSSSSRQQQQQPARLYPVSPGRPGTGSIYEDESIASGSVDMDAENPDPNGHHAAAAPSPESAAAAAAADRDLELVVASIQSEDTSWFHTHLPHWHKNIYVADYSPPTSSSSSSSPPPLTVPQNKGREAMVYLTYLIDRYDSLPRNILFVHASRFAWHNDDPDYDALPTLLDFRLPYLREQGYVNLRCVWTIGCPREIRPFVDDVAAGGRRKGKAGDGDEGEDDEEPLKAKHVYKQAFEQLLPGTPVPDLVAVSCCSQFGVTRETVRRRPRADYVHFRDWLLETPLDDALNGRVLEFSWHIIFGKEAFHCPSPAECYCNVFGHCNLTCTETGCESRYTLPPYSTLPKGWPKIGWDKEERNFTGPL